MNRSQGLMDVAPVPRSVLHRAKAAVCWWLEWDWLFWEQLADWLLGREYPRVYGEGLVAELASAALPRYWPTPLLTPMYQTLAALKVRALALNPEYRRMALRPPAGGVFAVDLYRGLQEGLLPREAPVLLILHGIVGSSADGYAKSLCAAAFAAGFRPAVLNYRGCGGMPLDSPATFSAAFTGDAHFAADDLQRRFPGAPLLLAGFSMGAMQAAKLLAELGTGERVLGAPVAAAVLSSSPHDLGAMAQRLASGRLLSAAFWCNEVIVGSLRAYARKHQAALREGGVDTRAVARARTLAQYDALVTCKVFGYARVADCYAAAHSGQHIPRIRTPTLLLSATDDLFVCGLPMAECRANPFTVLATTRRGGHCAHLQGVHLLGPTYMEDAAVGFFRAALATPLVLVAGRGEAACRLLPSTARIVWDAVMQMTRVLANGRSRPAHLRRGRSPLAPARPSNIGLHGPFAFA
ncbi:hypothetical protein WJX81_008546 [Elliptochloris bilobata]|uniref:Serine aminopeptidase S33 domain-containing protein n=1 Tax=Elliptochloris bilobata TaxID=381761 RepID=A0AAW1RWQ0_9CHLO